MTFDEIPENREESYPCPVCNIGSVTKNKDNIWQCDFCDSWIVANFKEENKK